MQYRLRPLLIVLAIGLALLQFAIFMIPYNVEVGEGTAWFLCLDFVSYVVPLVQISALAIALTIRNASSSNNQSHAPTLRFTIRDVLWLTLVVGLCVGWYSDTRRRQTEIRQWMYACRQFVHVLKTDGWHIQGGISGVTAEKGERSVELQDIPISTLE